MAAFPNTMDDPDSQAVPSTWGELSWRRKTDPAPARLSFHLNLRFHAPMDPYLENIIRKALADAWATGRDHLTQTELAVRAVLKARPDMTASEALSAVELVRRS